MNLLGLLAVVASIALLLLTRRAAEHDRAGNPALLLRPPALALLPLAGIFLWEALSYRTGPSFVRAPFVFYAWLFLGSLTLIGAALLFSFRITVEPKRVVKQLPLLWKRVVPLAHLMEVQDDALVPIVLFAGQQKITILPLYSGVSGFLDHLRAYHAELKQKPA
ncbi:MAG: hypothetical protein WAQ05_24105 [Rubrivivax sp.]